MFKLAQTDQQKDQQTNRQGKNNMSPTTIFHENQTIKVASIEKMPCPLAAMFFQATGTIFELIQDITGTNLLTKFHEHRTINVASRVLTRQILTMHDRQKATTKAHYEHIVLR
ncbi:hypothetical protein DPMN_188738 [Dreissena polymorpha]|uniref:Uncharacterized protein n=1 Tax=Dreissena polymorpha TaxID=45954 RepID=A0A9D4DRA9_DREPO|nr:hypothetical protein DPMN_188738 [Dreissena polymorpha]